MAPVASPGVSSRTSSTTTTWIAILLGIVALGLVSAFAIGLPEVVGEEQAAELSLPDTLPGGYAAADDPASFADGDYADQAGEIADQEKSNSDYGNKVLPDVLGHAAATRTYVLDGSKAVFVQVFAAEGGAFAPNSIPDPAASGGDDDATLPAFRDTARTGSAKSAPTAGPGPSWTAPGPPPPGLSSAPPSRWPAR